MKRLYGSPLAALVTICVLSLSACVKGDAPIGWPDVAHCAGDSVDDVIGSVVEVLMQGTQDDKSIGDAAVAELEKLGQEHGFELVACLVDQVVSDLSSPGASQTPDRMAMVARGRDFLATKEINVVRSPDAQ